MTRHYDEMRAELKAEIERLSAQIAPSPGYAHFGCPNCGYIRSLPWEPGEPLPWCVHADNYSWRPPHPETQAGPRAWTQMVPVTVRPVEPEGPRCKVCRDRGGPGILTPCPECNLYPPLGGGER